MANQSLPLVLPVDPSRSQADLQFLQQVQQVVTSHTQSGISSEYPSSGLFVGRTFFDTTINSTVVWNGVAWVNPSNAALFTSNSFLYGDATGGIGSTLSASDGQLLIGNSGNHPTLGSLTTGVGIGIITGPGAITIKNTGVTYNIGTEHEIDVSSATGEVVIKIANDVVLPGIQGITIPTGSNSDRPLAPRTGQFRFSSTLTQLEYWDGSAWEFMIDAGNLLGTTDQIVVTEGTGNLTLSMSPNYAAPKVVLANDTTNATEYLTFSAGATGNNALLTNSAFTVNPSTGTLSATHFSGASSSADTVAITTASTNATYYPTFVSASTGNLALDVNTSFSVNPSTAIVTANDLTLTGLTGNIITNTSVKTSLQALDDSVTQTNNSGHNQWTSGAPYWSNTGSTFTLLATGNGYINGKLISWTQPQSVTISSNTTQLVYINGSGTLSTLSQSGIPTVTSYQGKIPLFTVLYDGTVMVVCKEDHDYNISTQFVGYIHTNIGSIVQGSGGNLTQITTGTGGVATDREVMIVGAATISDSENSTTLPDSGGAAITIQWFYTNASGKWIQYANQQQVPIVYNNAGTITALSGTQRSVATIYAGKDNENTSTPIYIGVIDVNHYTSAGSARTAITNGTVAQVTNELQALQLAKLGAIIYTHAGSTYIDEVDISKSALNSFSSSGASGSAALTTVSTGTFTNFFTVADTTVQTALNDLDAGIVSTNTASTIVKRDGSGNFSAGTITAALTGNAATATALQTARTIGGISFNGTANIPINNTDDTTTNATFYPLFTSGTGVAAITSGTKLTYNPSTGTLKATTFNGALSGTATTAGTVTTAAQPSITSVGTLTSLTISGLVDISGASAGQIKFPSTQNASSDVNTLDDYAEGTWTPAFTGLTVVNGTGGATYSGTYTKIGRIVYYVARIVVSGTCTTASTAGTTYINNLPFTVGGFASTVCSSANTGTLVNYGGGLLPGTTTNAYTPTWAAANNNIISSGTYQV